MVVLTRRHNTGTIYARSDLGGNGLLNDVELAAPAQSRWLWKLVSRILGLGTVATLDALPRLRPLLGYLAVAPFLVSCLRVGVAVGVIVAPRIVPVPLAARSSVTTRRTSAIALLALSTIGSLVSFAVVTWARDTTTSIHMVVVTISVCFVWTVLDSQALEFHERVAPRILRLLHVYDSVRRAVARLVGHRAAQRIVGRDGDIDTPWIAAIGVYAAGLLVVATLLTQPTTATTVTSSANRSGRTLRRIARKRSSTAEELCGYDPRVEFSSDFSKLREAMYEAWSKPDPKNVGCPDEGVTRIGAVEVARLQRFDPGLVVGGVTGAFVVYAPVVPFVDALLKTRSLTDGASRASFAGGDYQVLVATDGCHVVVRGPHTHYWELTPRELPAVVRYASVLHDMPYVVDKAPRGLVEVRLASSGLSKWVDTTEQSDLSSCDAAATLPDLARLAS
jgi:hypothetical protein